MLLSGQARNVQRRSKGVQVAAAERKRVLRPGAVQRSSPTEGAGGELCQDFVDPIAVQTPIALRQKQQTLAGWPVWQGGDAQQSTDPWHVLAAEAAATEAGRPLPPCDRHMFPEWRLVTDAERPPSSAPTISRMCVACPRKPEIKEQNLFGQNGTALGKRSGVACFATAVSWVPTAR